MNDSVLVYLDGQPLFVPPRVDCHYAARGALGLPRGVAVVLEGAERNALTFVGGHDFAEGQRYRIEEIDDEHRA